MDAVYGSILENLRHINVVAEPTVEAFKKDRTNTGDSKEVTVKEFIERYLPADYRIKKGIIYAQEGCSQNIDCVVLHPIHPPLITPVREVILAEGVYAAVEVKPDIRVLTDESELLRGMKQISSVKALHRITQEFDVSKLTGDIPKPAYYSKIPCVLFCLQSGDIKETVEYIISKIHDGTLPADGIPDIIVALDKGVVFYSPHFSYVPVGRSLSKETLEMVGDKVFLYFESDKKEVTLTVFLQLFLTLAAPAMHMYSFIILDYLRKLPFPNVKGIFSVDKVLE